MRGSRQNPETAEGGEGAGYVSEAGPARFAPPCGRQRRNSLSGMYRNRPRCTDGSRLLRQASQIACLVTDFIRAASGTETWPSLLIVTTIGSNDMPRV